jgi:hypothetical protein
MQTEKKSSYTLITSNENSFSEFYTAFLEKESQKIILLFNFLMLLTSRKKIYPYF